MDTRRERRSRRLQALAGIVSLGALLVSCGGGGTGNERDSGPNKTTLRVQASDADGDALSYQWRVTAGSIENRNANETVWTLPDGPGLHFAYVTVSDGKGGYAEQQYAVATDALGTAAPVREARAYQARAVADFPGKAARLRFKWAVDPTFAPGGEANKRNVYLPDMNVQVFEQVGGQIVGAPVFSGVTDLSGEVSLPKLSSASNTSYVVQCSTTVTGPLRNCGSLSVSEAAPQRVVEVFPVLDDASSNLRLYGHVGFADGGVCGTQNDFFAQQSAATVQVLLADGTVLTAAQRVNRFGDYALDAAVPARAALKLKLTCEGQTQTVDVPAPGASGYVASAPVELSVQLANSRPRIVKMVANGPDGNVRGRMVVPETGAESNVLPGPDQFLVYKGKDTPLSACMYYRSIGAVESCDAQGRMTNPITLSDWERKHQFKPNQGSNVEVSAKYINQMDLNLVRFMRATQTAPDNIAFVVCNHPGPEGKSQTEIDQVIATGLAGEREVACVAMEWSTSPGVNNGQPFTKFLTFGPDGTLLPSVNLDGRGEKFLPGTCVACHGGGTYNGRFPEKGEPSPYLGARFLAFDTGNYLFSSDPLLTEAAQSESIYGLNQLVKATEPSASSPTSTLISSWYTNGSKTLDKSYLPPVWQAEAANTPNIGLFYHQVVGSACRTCHVAMGPDFDWDSIVLRPSLRGNSVLRHVCGGTPDIARNASMPNALISRDRIAERVRASPELAALMTSYLGCSAPLPDPAYPKR